MWIGKGLRQLGGLLRQKPFGVGCVALGCRMMEKLPVICPGDPRT